VAVDYKVATTFDRHVDERTATKANAFVALINVGVARSGSAGARCLHVVESRQARMSVVCVVASLTRRAVLGPRSHDGLDRSTYLPRPDLYLPI
jgi:hypothetical protein